MEYILKKSNRKGKRFMIKIDNKNYHFGALPFEKGTFIDHKNQKIKNAWIARHKDDKNYNNKKSGIYYSRHLLFKSLFFNSFLYSSSSIFLITFL